MLIKKELNNITLYAEKMHGVGLQLSIDNWAIINNSGNPIRKTDLIKLVGIQELIKINSYLLRS
jgi:hypothetical protein